MQSARPIAVLGDWHGDLGWALTAARSAAREGARTALHVGDFGLDWPGPKRGRYEAKLNKYLTDLALTIYVSVGDHDNIEYAAALPVENDGAAVVRSNIRVPPRGGRTVVEGLVIGALGGAFSVDYEHRTEGRDWWANEQPTPEEAKRLTDGGPLDILITHDAPSGVQLKGDFDLRPELASKANITRDLLGEVVDSSPFRTFLWAPASAPRSGANQRDRTGHARRRTQQGALEAWQRCACMAWQSAIAH